MDKKNSRKGIILAGGSGSRLYPITSVVSKQLLPVYNKPMIYYPLSTLMLASIKEILIITTPEDQNLFRRLLGDGSQFGIELCYAVQPTPDGLAQAFIIGKDFLDNHSSALILGDNLFYGADIENILANANKRNKGASIFTHHVKDPERYGVAEFRDKKVISIIEKPTAPKSNNAVTGLYFYDENVLDYVRELKPSKRGELEITDLNNMYLKNNSLFVEPLSPGFCWFDTGTHDSLIEASQFIASVEKRQDVKVACLEEIALNKNWITYEQLEKTALKLNGNEYGLYLLDLLKNK